MGKTNRDVDLADSLAMPFEPSRVLARVPLYVFPLVLPFQQSRASQHRNTAPRIEMLAVRTGKLWASVITTAPINRRGPSVRMGANDTSTLKRHI